MRTLPSLMRLYCGAVQLVVQRVQQQLSPLLPTAESLPTRALCAEVPVQLRPGHCQADHLWSPARQKEAGPSWEAAHGVSKPDCLRAISPSPHAVSMISVRDGFYIYVWLDAATKAAQSAMVGGTGASKRI